MKSKKNVPKKNVPKKSVLKKKNQVIQKKDKTGGKKSFKSELAELVENDPEFLEFLKKEEADLLEFDNADESDSIDDGYNVDEDDDRDIEENGDGIDEDSGPDENFAVDDNVEEDEEEEEIAEDFGIDAGKRVVDERLIKKISTVLENPLENRPKLAEAVQTAIKCFESCVCSLGGGGTQSKKNNKKRRPSKGKGKPQEKKSTGKKTITLPKITSNFIIKREDIFDEVLRICFAHMGRCLLILLNPIEKKKDKGKKLKKKKKSTKKNITIFKHWHKYGVMTKQFLNALSVLLSELQHNDEIVCEALNAASALVDLYLHFPKASKLIIKTVVRLWSRRQEDVQSSAFIVLCKFVRLNAESAFPLVYKNCYVAYISNCKQVNAESKPLIEFMQKCFVELSLLAPKMAYQYAFVYIRQFAIHLRTAIMGKKRDLIPKVYNWQFLNGLSVWAMVIARSAEDPVIFSSFRELCHPLTEITILLKRSFMSSKYIPLAIFCIRILLRLQKGCKIFIPTLAMSLELLNELLQIDKSKPTVGKSVQKADLTGIYRLSKAQLLDSGVRSLLAQQIFSLSLECSNALKQNPAFPEILVPLEPIIKSFTKKCRNPEHVEMSKTLNSKLRKQAEEISKKVSASALDLRTMKVDNVL